MDKSELTDEQLRPFKCKDCNTRYTRAEHLTRHVVSRHHGDPPASSNLPRGPEGGVGSEGATASGAELKQGSQADGRWRGFVCSTCGKGFGRRDILKRHEKGHLKTAAAAAASADDEPADGSSAGSAKSKKRSRASKKADSAGGEGGGDQDDFEAAAAVGAQAPPSQPNRLRAFGSSLNEAPTFEAPFPSVASTSTVPNLSPQQQQQQQQAVQRPSDEGEYPLDPGLLDPNHPNGAVYAHGPPYAEGYGRGYPDPHFPQTWHTEPGRSPTSPTFPGGQSSRRPEKTRRTDVYPHLHSQTVAPPENAGYPGGGGAGGAEGFPRFGRPHPSSSSPTAYFHPGPNPVGPAPPPPNRHPPHAAAHFLPLDAPPHHPHPQHPPPHPPAHHQHPPGLHFAGFPSAPPHPPSANELEAQHQLAQLQGAPPGSEDFYGWAASAFPPPLEILGGFPLSIRSSSGTRSSGSAPGTSGGSGSARGGVVGGAPDEMRVDDQGVAVAPSNWLTIPDFASPAPATALNAEMAAWGPLHAPGSKAGPNVGAPGPGGVAGNGETHAIVESLLALSSNPQPLYPHSAAPLEPARRPPAADVHPTKIGVEREKTPEKRLPKKSWRPDPPKISLSQAARDRMQAEAQEHQRRSAFPDSRIDVPPRAVLEQCIQDDMSNGRPEMPLHAPTFDPNTAPTFLVLAIASQGARDSRVISNPHVLAEALSELATRCLGSLYPSAQFTVGTPEYQHAWLLVMYDAFSSGNRAQLKQSELMQSYLALGCRRLGRLIEPAPVVLTADTDLDMAWKQWRDQEYAKRIGIMVIIHTGVGCMLWDFEPNTLFTETAKCTLPCSDEMWNAPSAEAWRDLFAGRPSPTRAMNIREAMRLVLSSADSTRRRDLASSLSLLQAKSILFLLLLLTVDLHKRAATEFVFFSSGRISDAAFEAQRRSEEMIEHGYDFLEGWLANVAYDAQVDRMYYCTLAGFFHMASIVGHRLPLGVLQSFVRYEPQTRRGLSETLEAWATADDGRLARRTTWHAGQIIGLHHRDPENPAFWYLENSLAIFYASLTVYCFSVFVPSPPLSSADSAGGKTLSLDHLESRTSPHVTAWIDGPSSHTQHHQHHHHRGRRIPSIAGVQDLHAPGAPDRILVVGSAMLARFKVAGVAQMLGNVLKRFREVGPHLGGGAGGGGGREADRTARGDRSPGPTRV